MAMDMAMEAEKMRADPSPIVLVAGWHFIQY
jgi:hypothetical protein